MVGEELRTSRFHEAFLEPGTDLRAQPSQCLLALNGVRVARRTTVEGATGVQSTLRRRAERLCWGVVHGNTGNIVN